MKIYILEADCDGTMRSIEEPIGIAVRTEEEAKAFLKDKYGYSRRYQEIEIIDDYFTWKKLNDMKEYKVVDGNLVLQKKDYSMLHAIREQEIMKNNRKYVRDLNEKIQNLQKELLSMQQTYNNLVYYFNNLSFFQRLYLLFNKQYIKNKDK